VRVSRCCRTKRGGVIRRCASPLANARGRPFGRSTLRVVRVVIVGVGAIRAANWLKDVPTDRRTRRSRSGRRLKVTPLSRRCRASAGARTARPTENSDADDGRDSNTLYIRSTGKRNQDEADSELRRGRRKPARRRGRQDGMVSKVSVRGEAIFGLNRAQRSWCCRYSG
jgi:hypothetical protein